MLDNKLRDKWNQLNRNYDDLKKHVDVSRWSSEISSYEQKMTNPDFWNNQTEATKINKKIKILKDRVHLFTTMSDDINSLHELIEIADEDSQVEIEQIIDGISPLLERLQTQLLFTEEMDESDAILQIHPGAGGTESCDWAEMLSRMYLKFFIKHNFKYTVIDQEPGDVAGIKSISFTVSGEFAYGMLRSEIGVHRLVRVSPFDANGRRHTSFASVYVLPDIEQMTDFDIDEKDLRIEAFRSGGPGGQNVNKVSSAIRITHVPSGLFAKSQTERSQIQNKMNAMKVLKAKVYEHYKKIEQENISSKLEKKAAIEWGNQIRSYVFYPYKMIKDLRTRYETGDVDSVMDGDIDRFIREYLIMKAQEREEAKSGE